MLCLVPKIINFVNTLFHMFHFANDWFACQTFQRDFQNREIFGMMECLFVRSLLVAILGEIGETFCCCCCCCCCCSKCLFEFILTIYIGCLKNPCFALSTKKNLSHFFFPNRDESFVFDEPFFDSSFRPDLSFSMTAR